MTQKQQAFVLEAEPDDLGPEPEPLEGEVVAAAPAELPLVRSLPAGFNLPALLQFVPDVRLKHAADAAARAALAVDVAAPDGPARLDEELAVVRTRLKAIDEPFEIPTALANKLHKRLTGLRADFRAEAEDALEKCARRLYDEQRRRERLAVEEQRHRQEEADRQAKAAAEKAAKAAKRSGAPAPVVEALKEQAKAATAPPVHAASPPPPQNSALVEKWRARLVGTDGDAEDQQPLTRDFTQAQNASLIAALQDVIAGRAPLLLVNVNWPYANELAERDRDRMRLAGFEAYDAGSVRGKGRRR